MAKQTHLLPYARRADFHVGRAGDLSGRDRVFYRFLEIVPGVASWATLMGVVFASIYAPFFAAYFIIAFSVYWVLKTAFLSYHLRHNWLRVRQNLKIDWEERIRGFKYEHLHHLIIIPYMKEGDEVLNATLHSLSKVVYDHAKFIVVLSGEGWHDESVRGVGERMQAKWSGSFGGFYLTLHPDIEGEMHGKGSNSSWAAEFARTEILDKQKIPYEHVIVSVFDGDTVTYPHYFNCLVWHFMTAARPQKSSYQPVPLFNNNMWEANALSRVIAMSSTFWEMVQQERPERMATFSSHSIPFLPLYEVGYWQKNMVSEDSRIYWNLLVANNGEYDVIPLSYPVSMDATTTPTFWGTIKNIYKQHRRWTYGVENFIYITYHFTKNKTIPLGQRIRIGLQQAEGYWSLVTNPIMLFVLGWAPIFLGSRMFHETVLSYNLPIVVRNLLILAMFGLVISSMISLTLLPERPEGASRMRYVVLALQWLLVPITMIMFSALPGLDAQTRLMVGKYLGFWSTPKHR